MEETKRRKMSQAIMTKNVTQFKHLLQNPFATEKDVTWAINLRQYPRNTITLSKQSAVPQVYHKKTALTAIRQQQFSRSKSKGFLPFHCNEFHHMIPKLNEKTLKHSSSAIQFFSSLRAGETYNDKQNRKKFSCIPYKDKNKTPKILKKAMYSKKTKAIQDQDLQSALDGNQNYPQYTEKILRNRNYAVLKTFTSIKGRGKIGLPGLAWQIGLRNY